MSGFDDRKKGQEAKFAHDAELRFKAEARRNKLLGMWAAEQLGLSGTEANAYAAEVVASDFAEAGDEDVFRKVAGGRLSQQQPVSLTGRERWLPPFSFVRGAAASSGARTSAGPRARGHVRRRR